MDVRIACRKNAKRPGGAILGRFGPAFPKRAPRSAFDQRALYYVEEMSARVDLRFRAGARRMEGFPEQKSRQGALRCEL